MRHEIVCGLQKPGKNHTPRCKPADGPNAPRRYPLYCAGAGEGGKALLYLRTGLEARTNHTWQAAGAERERERGWSNIIEAQSAASAADPTHSRPSPDALDEPRDAVHGVAVVRHDAAHSPLNVHQPPVAAREQQQTALARAVVCQWHLSKSHASLALSAVT
jgi:hypothetical protein